MRVVSIVNQKGGVGKTTTTVNLGHALARQGRRVLLLDLDPQGHLTACVGLFRVPPGGTDQVLSGERTLAACAIPVAEWGCVVPCGKALTAFERQASGPRSGVCLRDAIDRAPPDVDYLLIDCPPSSGQLIVNAIVAADDVLIPVAGDYLSLTGLARLMLTIKGLQAMCRPAMRKWVFMSRFVARRRLSREVYDKVREHFPHSLLCGVVSESAALAESAGAGRSIFDYRPRSRAATEFDALAEDLIQQRVIANEQETASYVA